MVAVMLGREAEMVAVDRLLDSGRSGRAVLVLEGNPGIGKTTVWRHGITRAAAEQFRVLSCRAAPTEARLSFTALGDLLAPVEPAAFAALPDPQRRALDAALLRADADGAAANPRTANPRLIGTAIVSLLLRLATTGPVLLAIDDLQWLDTPSARALEFALRRLESHRIAVLATVRLGEGKGGVLRPPGIDAIDTVRLGPLSLGALYRIIEAQLGLALPRPLLVKIEHACGGNPFYALEIARALGSTANVVPGQELPIPDDLRELLAKRLRRLPQRTRDALLKVSALARPTIGLVDHADLTPAEEARVVRVLPEGRIEFSHPLFASAVYATASHERRQKLHAELAEIASDVEERARHLMFAQTSSDADGRVADVLHVAAEHALTRGAIEIAAELDEQSARRTPADQMVLRWQRYLRAARHYLKAGDPGRSRLLCDEVLCASPPSSVRAHGLHILAETLANEDLVAAVPLLQEALACVGEDWVHAAQLEIALGIVFGSGLDQPRGERHAVRAVAFAERAGDTALLSDALALAAVSGLLCGLGVEEQSLERALALEDLDHEVSFQMRASLNISLACLSTGRFDVAERLLGVLGERLTARGEESDLPQVLVYLAILAWIQGNLEEAEQRAGDAERVAALNGVEIFRTFALCIRGLARASRGACDGARADGMEALALAERIGWLYGTMQARWTLGFLAVSESDPAAAAAILAPSATAIEAAGVYEFPVAGWVPDAIEAFVATGAIERATRLTDAFSSMGRKFDRPWALATSGRCRMLVAAAAGDLDGARAAGEQALVEHERLPCPLELARTLLAFGQLLRRRGERRLARETLQRALTIFEEIGAPLWVDKARAEIARIGVRHAPKELTESEQRVAKLAAQGLTNSEIATRLFMSRRTVETNLARAYAKLGIHSRAELGAVMAKRGEADPS